MGAQSSGCPLGYLTVSISGGEALLLMMKWQEADLRDMIRQGVYRGAPLPGTKPQGIHGWEDALQKFPNDVQFLSRAEAERNLETTRKLLQRRVKVPFEEQWTAERVAAVAGADMAAKRAAMSNTLWRFYKAAEGGLTVDDLRHVYKIGLFRDLWEKETNPDKKDQFWQMMQSAISERGG